MAKVHHFDSRGRYLGFSSDVAPLGCIGIVLAVVIGGGVMAYTFISNAVNASYDIRVAEEIDLAHDIRGETSAHRTITSDGSNITPEETARHEKAMAELAARRRRIDAWWKKNDPETHRWWINEGKSQYRKELGAEQ